MHIHRLENFVCLFCSTHEILHFVWRLNPSKFPRTCISSVNQCHLEVLLGMSFNCQSAKCLGNRMYFCAQLCSHVYGFWSCQNGWFKKQRICVKFCFTLNSTPAETHHMVKEAFGKQILSQERTFEWFKCFKYCQESVEDLQHLTQQLNSWHST